MEPGSPKNHDEPRSGQAVLLGIDGCTTDFSVIFTGKKSSMVNGLYKPMTREILIHNKNFENDGQLIYTAIHVDYLDRALGVARTSAGAAMKAFTLQEPSVW